MLKLNDMPLGSVSTSMSTWRRNLTLAVAFVAMLVPLGCSDRIGLVGEERATLVVEPGTVDVLTVLSGTAEATEALALTVPEVGVSPVQVRFLVENGMDVAEGDVVAELDNSSLVSNLEQLENAVIQAETTWLATRARVGSEVETARFEVLQKQAEHDKAAIAARIPEDLQSAREYEQLVLARDKTALELEQAALSLAAQEEAGDAAIAADEVALEKAMTAWQRSQEGIDKVVLRAPRDGVAQLGRNHFEDRMVQEGDSMIAGWTLVSLPDLRSLRVRARLYDVDDGQVAVGQEATVFFDAYPERPLRAQIVRTDEIAHQRGRRSTVRAFAVQVELIRSGEEGTKVDRMNLLPGMSARVEVRREREPTEQAADAPVPDSHVRVPRAALHFGTRDDEQGEDAVWLVTASGKRIDVTLGTCSAMACELIDGPAAGTELRDASGESA